MKAIFFERMSKGPSKVWRNCIGDFWEDSIYTYTDFLEQHAAFKGTYLSDKSIFILFFFLQDGPKSQSSLDIINNRISFNGCEEE